MTDKWNPDLPVIYVSIEEGPEDRRRPEFAILIDDDGIATWTAANADEVDRLRAMVAAVNAKRAEAGLDPIRQIGPDFPAPTGRAAFLAELMPLIERGDLIAWTVDLKPAGSIEATYGVLPGIFRTAEGQHGYAPLVDPGDIERAAAANTGTALVLDNATLAAAGEDYATRHDRMRTWAADHTPMGVYADGTPAYVVREPLRSGKSNLLGSTHGAVYTRLAAARDAIVTRLPEGADRDELAVIELDHPNAVLAFSGVADDPNLLVAASALVWALTYAQRGNFVDALVWCDRSLEVFTDPTTGDVNPDIANSIELTWTADDGETYTGRIRDLAGHIQNASLAGGPYVDTVYQMVDGERVKVEYHVDGTGYDEHDWGTSVLTVDLIDGSRLQDSWRVDGRA